MEWASSTGWRQLSGPRDSKFGFTNAPTVVSWVERRVPMRHALFSRMRSGRVASSRAPVQKFSGCAVRGQLKMSLLVTRCLRPCHKHEIVFGHITQLACLTRSFCLHEITLPGRKRIPFAGSEFRDLFLGQKNWLN